jgi:Uma2 family endonuclease
MTVDEYLAWSDSQSERQRTELINGQIVIMPAERLVHTYVKARIFLALQRAIESAGLPCHALPDGPGVRIDEHTVYEPDALVFCGSAPPGDSMLIPNPVILVEVLSPTTRHHDTSAKLIGYFKVPSVVHYLVVDADDCTVTHYRRDGTPNLVTSGALRLDPPGIDLSVDALFAKS